MNPFIRTIIRKEFREIMPIWLTLLIAGPVCWLSFQVLTILLQVGTETVSYMTGIFVFVLVYTIIVSSQSFVREIEGGTYSALRRFPVSCRTVATGKCLAIIISILALAAGLSLMALIISMVSDNARPEDIWSLIGRFGIAILEALCIGLFISVRCRHEYTSLIVTLITLFVWDITAQYLITFLWEKILLSSLDTTKLEATIPVMTGKLLSLVILAPGLFGTFRWFAIQDEYRPYRHKFFRRRKTSGKSFSDQCPISGELRGLLWQGWRQSCKKIMLLSMIMGAVILYMVYLIWTESDIRNCVLLDGTKNILFWIFIVTFAYTFLMSMEIYHADFRQKETVLTTRFAVTPWKFWLSRLILFGLPVLLLVTVVFGLLQFVYISNYVHSSHFWGTGDTISDVSLWWNSLWLGYLDFGMHPNISDMSMILIFLYFQILFFASLTIFIASTCRRRLNIIGLVLLLTLLFALILQVKIPSFQCFGNFVLTLWLIFAFLFLSYRMITARLRSRRVHPLGLASWCLVLIPIIVTNIWSMEWNTLVLPQQEAIFTVDFSRLQEPFDRNNQEDAHSIRLRENVSIALYHRVFQTFSLKAAYGNYSFLPVHDLSCLENGWEKFLLMFKQSDEATELYSVELERVITESIYEHCDEYSPDELHRAFALLKKISQTRPDGVEQERRMFLFYARLIARGGAIDDPYIPGYHFFVENNSRKRQLQKMLWNEFQNRAIVAKMRDRFYHNEIGDSFNRYLASEMRLLQRGHSIDHTFYTIPSYFSLQYIRTETLRRMLLVQLATLLYYHDHGQYPYDWNELVTWKYLEEIPCVFAIDVKYSISKPFDPNGNEGKKLLDKIKEQDKQVILKAKFILDEQGQIARNFYYFGNSSYSDNSFKLNKKYEIWKNPFYYTDIPVIYDPYFRTCLELKPPKRK